MAVTVTVVSSETYRDERGRRHNRVLLAVEGLEAGNNNVPHGLPVIPSMVLIEPTSAAGASIYEYLGANDTYVKLYAVGNNPTCNLRLEWRP